VTVQITAKQAEDTRFDWVERSIWTDPMLTALVMGVKGGKWFSLIDKVYRESTLLSAFARVAKNKGCAGIDNISIERYRKNLLHHTKCLSEDLREGRYKPEAIQRREIPKGKGKTRPLGISTVRDRVVQTALKMVIEPIFVNDYAPHSYGFVPTCSCQDALREVNVALKSGALYVLDADLKSYFDTIDHDILMSLLEDKISDSRVLALIEGYLKQNVISGCEEWTPEEGSPQGAVISPLLANIYLNGLDHQMADEGYRMIRYADDFVILCESEADCEEALGMVKRYCQKMKLTLNEEKTSRVSLKDKGTYFEFLGYKFGRSRKGRLYHLFSRKSEKRFREKLRPLTKRTSGKSMEETISKLNPILRGWYNYFKHSPHWTYSTIDKYCRQRLRSILRKRRKRKGRAQGTDYYRWPNSHFYNLGLFSLVEAHRLECQSLRS